MPKAVEEHLRAAAAKKGFVGDRADRFVFGTLNNMGLMHGNKPTGGDAATALARRRKRKD